MSQEQSLKLKIGDLNEVVGVGRNAQLVRSIDAFIGKAMEAKILDDTRKENWRRSFSHSLRSYLQGERQNAQVMGTYWIDVYERYNY